MVKKVLAICDREKDYLCHLADYLERKERLPFIVHVFTGEAQLRRFAEKQEGEAEQESIIEMLLISESVCKEWKGAYPAQKVIMLNESGVQTGEGIEYINKFQSAENIYREMMDIYADTCPNEYSNVPANISGGEEGKAGGINSGIERRGRTGRRMKIIGNYTPIGRCMQTTFALSMGQILAKKHRTLYLNFESYSGLGCLLGKEFAVDITDALYYLNCERGKLPYKLNAMVQTVNGLDYIPPVISYEELGEICAEQWIDLFQEIEKNTDYEYLILDLSEAVSGLFQILKECYRVFTIIREDGFAEAKLRQYEEMLQGMHYEDIAWKTRKQNLPVFHRIPAGLEELTHGEVAAYIRRVIEEDVYECAG